MDIPGGYPGLGAYAGSLGRRKNRILWMPIVCSSDTGGVSPSLA